MQQINNTKSTLLSTISVKGFSSIFMIFLVTVSVVMLVSMTLPIEYSSAKIEKNCAFNDNQACLDKLIENGSPFTIKVNAISALNQKVYVYLTYELKEKPSGRVRMNVESSIYKPIVSDEQITSYNQVELIKHTNKRYRSFCFGNNKCQMKIQTIESSKQYDDVYVVLKVSSSEISTGLQNPSLSIVYINKQYTLFEVFWRIALLVFMSFCTLFYMWIMRSISFKNWSIEQKWTVFFMITLTISNNGFYAYEFISANEFFPTVNAICDSIMLCGLFLYILIIMEALRKPLSQRSIFYFYLPRIILVVVLFVLILSLYIYNANNSDPVMIMMRDPVNATLVILTLIVSLVYLFWLIFAMIRSFSEARKLGEVGKRIKLYGTFTLIAFSILFILVVANYVTGYKSNQSAYLTLIAYINVYAVILMIFYFPQNKISEDWSEKRKEIVLDDFKVSEYDDDDNELVIEENNDTIIIDDDVNQ